jgi:formylglycine-generating enzyme required for sulfatase activity
VAEKEEKRVALVIGNAVYRHADTLKNPANDAKAISAALARLGFTGAKPQLNLDFNGLRRALQDFAKDADSADMALIYFAGHGIEVDMRNFLIPTDAKLERSKDVEFETVSLDQVLSSVDGARQLRLIILDACRNNPFRARMLRSGGQRSIGQGLRSVEPGGNVLVAYAAKHGTYALDGKADNSPFAEALRNHIEKPGLEIGQLFREVRDDVLERTGNEQEPHIYGSLGREGIYLKPMPPAETDNPTPLVPPRTNGASEPAKPSPSILQHPLLVAAVSGVGASIVALIALQMGTGGAQCSATEWQEAKERRSFDAYQKFAADCQHTTFAIYAREELEKLDNVEWEKARSVKTEAAYRAYLVRWGNGASYAGKHVAEAEEALRPLAAGKPPGTKTEEREADRVAKLDDAAFAKAKQLGTKSALTDYLLRYQKGRNVEAARSELTRLGFVEVAVGGANEARWIEAGGGKKDGESFKDCPDCPEMVVVPAGRFMMGSPDNEVGRSPNEGPQHEVNIQYALGVGKFEVTFAEWDACVNAGGCTQMPGDRGWGRGDRPVINVSWDDITKEYLPWLSKETNKQYRLLSEAEWEYAARAGRTGAFSFDGKITTDKANYDGTDTYGGGEKEEYRQKTVPVKSFLPNPWGLYQVHGNASEWVQECKENYLQTPRDGHPTSTTLDCDHVRRGGAWHSNPFDLRLAARGDRVEVKWWRPKDYGMTDWTALGPNISSSTGFRVARTL